MKLFQKIFGGGQTVSLRHLVDKGAFLVDVREPGEFAGGSVKGAVNIPLGNIPSCLTKFKGKESSRIRK